MIKSVKTLLAGLVFAAAATTAAAGTGDRTLQPGDYDLWHKLILGSVSPDGRYLSYTTKYPDTAEHVVVDTVTGREATRMSASAVPVGSYSPDSKWYVARGSGGTRLVNLDGGETITSIAGNTRYGFTGGSDYFVAWERGEDATRELGTLFVISLKDAARIEVEGVTSHKLVADGRTLAFVQQSDGLEELRVMELGQSSGTSRVLLATGNTLRLPGLDAGDSFSVVERAEPDKQQPSGTVTHYFEPDVAAEGYRHYRYSHGTGTSPVSDVVQHQWYSSEHGPVLVFGEASGTGREAAAGSDAEGLTDKVQVWHSMDSRIVTDRKRKPLHRYFAWWPRTGKLVNVTDDHSSIEFVTKGAAHAVVQSTDGVLRDSFRDVSARREWVDLATGRRQVLFQGGENHVIRALDGSPCGRYVAYLEDSSWWVHDLQDGTRHPVDHLVNQPLLQEQFDEAGHVPPYGSGGWTTAGELVLYDRYDVWLVDPGKMSARRITYGRSAAKVYRVDRHANRTDHFQNGLDGDDGIVLSVFNEATKQSGYSIYREGAGVTDLVYEDAHVGRILRRPGRGFVHTRERFDTPPQIVAVDSTGHVERVVFRSNPHHADFKWGQARLIDYVGKSGKPLQGVLLYPADYREDSDYPMIVSIYERQSHRLHMYEIPSHSSYMPLANYTGDGYFVLLPDIEYGPGGPGDWALHSVTAAVQAALQVARIDRGAIGLTGASWGGYQTLYIAGNSDLFATAVAGSAVSDMVSNYLSVEPGMGVPTSWRYETQQLRLHHPLHERFMSYVESSPIFHADGITIPVLSWHGQDDELISSSQALEMHLLLRRMRRHHVLLMYPGEMHVIYRDVNKAVDLSSRMKQWFDHYLKGVEAPDWILVGHRPR